jgi:hypothetical protein
MRTAIASLACLALAVSAGAAEESLRRVALRVLAPGSDSGTVVVDRGRRDGVEVGDRVSLFPREGGDHKGAVVRVDERSAVVELDDRGLAPEPGTRGEILVPEARTAGSVKAEQPGTEEAPTEAAEPPLLEEKEQTWTPDMPLLTDMRPVRPSERPKRLTGRVYSIGAVTYTPGGGYSNSLFRLGTDLAYLNPFRKGGEFRFNGEAAYLTKPSDDTGSADLLVRRLSYFRGGSRFARDRWEAGRFLQSGVPEFGYLDGFEWGRRRGSGHRYGASIGFMPEPDDSFESFGDLQVAGFYEWVADPREQLTASLGYQKTWHDWQPDRDLVVGRLRYLPVRGWNFHGVVWVDLYTGSDELKGSGVEVTQAIAALGQRGTKSGFDLTYRRLRFPELLRNGEFLPPLDAEIAGNRYDRLAFNGWWELRPKLRIDGFASGWNDEDGNGGAGELELRAKDLLLDRSDASLAVFVSFAQFEDASGIRATYGRQEGRGRWDLFYEISEHHLTGFPNDRDDLLQHRIRASGSLMTGSGMDLSLFAEGLLWDIEFSWSLGFSFQRRF